MWIGHKSRCVPIIIIYVILDFHEPCHVFEKTCMLAKHTFSKLIHQLIIFMLEIGIVTDVQTVRKKPILPPLVSCLICHSPDNEAACNGVGDRFDIPSPS